MPCLSLHTWWFEFLSNKADLQVEFTDLSIISGQDDGECLYEAVPLRYFLFLRETQRTRNAEYRVDIRMCSTETQS